MPITQSRFLSVIDGARAILDTHRALRATLRDSAELISHANATLAHTTDPLVRESLSSLTGTLATLAEILNSSLETHLDLTARIMAEDRHFAKAKARNERQAKVRELRLLSSRPSAPSAPSVDFTQADALLTQDEIPSGKDVF
jgi:hypothetical protein